MERDIENTKSPNWVNYVARVILLLSLSSHPPINRFASLTQIYNHLVDNQHQSRQHKMPTLAKAFPDFVNNSRGDFWCFRIGLMVVAVFSAIIPAVVLTWIVDSKFHVTKYSKYQELPWGVHV